MSIGQSHWISGTTLERCGKGRRKLQQTIESVRELCMNIYKLHSPCLFFRLCILAKDHGSAEAVEKQFVLDLWFDAFGDPVRGFELVLIQTVADL